VVPVGCCCPIRLTTSDWSINGRADHTNAVAGGRPVIALDMYEHAYHMDYGAKAGAYVDAFMEAINWENAAKLYERLSREG